MYVCVYTCACISVYLCAHVYMLCVSVHMHTQAHAHCMHVCTLYVSVCVRARLCVHMCMYVHACCVHTRACICVYVQLLLPSHPSPDALVSARPRPCCLRPQYLMRTVHLPTGAGLHALGPLPCYCGSESLAPRLAERRH